MVQVEFKARKILPNKKSLEILLKMIEQAFGHFDRVMALLLGYKDKFVEVFFIHYLKRCYLANFLPFLTHCGNFCVTQQ